MTIRLLVSCDGRPSDRDTIALEKCRAFLPVLVSTVGEARAVALSSGWSTRWDPGTWPATSMQQELCPSCTRAVSEGPRA